MTTTRTHSCTALEPVPDGRRRDHRASGRRCESPVNTAHRRLQERTDQTIKELANWTGAMEAAPCWAGGDGLVAFPWHIEPFS
jgi:hypothetical protein